MDLLDLWRDRISVRKVLNLIDHLPSTSHFVAAIADDPDLPPPPEEGRRSGPRLTEWTPEVRALADLIDRIGALIRVQVAQNSRGRPPEITPYPRPDTAARRAERRARREAHYALVARVKRRRSHPPGSA
ncbi:hypothetical protein [Actinomadura rudentiformis]|uniref:Uncharacterized protein n=1 Tax=Actinomadura rudentiformis TaxID=359158 RepID=A0A6H9YKD4_9ACTN|nr:hypothetical protein [Actinomadura rudentiformis]KAB2344883.1 hypothetical protein F8566_30300 [Actinomadura rudentiformis]